MTTEGEGTSLYNDSLWIMYSVWFDVIRISVQCGLVNEHLIMAITIFIRQRFLLLITIDRKG